MSPVIPLPSWLRGDGRQTPIRSTWAKAKWDHRMMSAANRGARRSIFDLLEGLVRQQSPAPLGRVVCVLRTTERKQADAVVFGVSPRASRDDDAIAGFQRVAIDFPRQLRRRRPLDDVTGLGPVFFGDIHIDK